MKKEKKLFEIGFSGHILIEAEDERDAMDKFNDLSSTDFGGMCRIDEIMYSDIVERSNK